MFDEIFRRGELRDNRTAFFFTKHIGLDETNTTQRWLYDNVSVPYYDNFMTTILDQYIDRGVITDTFKANIVFLDSSTATQFKLVFPEWQELNIGEEDEKMAKRMIKKIVYTRYSE